MIIDIVTSVDLVDHRVSFNILSLVGNYSRLIALRVERKFQSLVVEVLLLFSSLGLFKGTIVEYNPEKHYGFINDDRLFFHDNEVLSSLSRIACGAKVEFEVGYSNKHHNNFARYVQGNILCGNNFI